MMEHGTHRHSKKSAGRGPADEVPMCPEGVPEHIG